MVTIIVMTSNNYLDLIDPFYRLFQKNWPKSLDYKIYFVGEDKKVDIDFGHFFSFNNKLSWSKRLLDVLKQIDDDYIYFFMEDYFVSSEIKAPYLDSLNNFLNTLKPNYVRLINVPFKFSADLNLKFLPFNRPHPYSINLQVSVWNKNFLVELIKNNDYSPWQIEELLNYKYSKNSDLANSKLYYTNLSIIKNINGVIKGKWTTKGLSFLRSSGVVKNGEEFFSKRGKLSFFHSLRIFIFKISNFVIPFFLRKKLKKLLGLFGIRFATNT
jgi:hypothetical protein